MYHDLSKIRGLGLLGPGDPGYLGPSYDEPQPVRSSLFDEAAAVHEAGHAVHSYYNRQQIFDISINKQGLGGGEFRNVPHTRDISEGDAKELAASRSA
jgi:hypothetical protein